jgi:hypothetical protein
MPGDMLMCMRLFRYRVYWTTVRKRVPLLPRLGTAASAHTLVLQIPLVLMAASFLHRLQELVVVTSATLLMQLYQ